MRNTFEEQIEAAKKTKEAQHASANAAPLTPAAGLHFVVPTEVVDLPSRGKFYAEGHPLKDKATIEIKQMTAKEEDILTNKSFVRKGIVIDKLIESIVVDTNIKAGSLLAGDKTAIMIAARSSAYGPDYKVTLTCLECGTKDLHVVDLSSSVIRDADSILEESKLDRTLEHGRLANGSIVVQLPKTKFYVECRMLTGEDEKTLMTYLENKKKVNAGDEITLTEQLFLIVDSINGVNDKKELAEAIKKLPAFDAKYLRTVYQKLVPNIKLSLKYTCAACSSQQDGGEIPFTEEFFWPK
jgi:hypothetical protein